MLTYALTELLGTPVFDTAGSRCGRVREVALIPQEDRARVAILIIRTSTGDRLLPFVSVTSINGGIRTDSPTTDWAKREGAEGMLLLGRDLLDQQVPPQQEHALCALTLGPVGRRGVGANAAIDGGDGNKRQQAVAGAGSNDQYRNPSAVFLRNQRHLTHPAAPASGGVEHRSAQ